MTARAGLLAAVLLLASLAFGCGKQEEQPPATTHPASPTPGVAATEGPAVASPPAAAHTTLPRSATPAATALPAGARPPATVAPLTTQAAPPQAPPPPIAVTSAPRPQGKVTLPAKLGVVTFDHEKHAGKLSIACTTCHHPSRAQKPLASERQACRGCHTMPAAPPMKTSLQGAFHDPKGATGTCIDCHKQKGGLAPVKCLECHRKE